MNNDLTALREQIDDIDNQIHDLLMERATCALDVAKAKIAEQGKDASLYQPKREQEIIERILARNKVPLTDEAARDVFKMIIKVCLELQIQHHPELKS